MNLLCIVEAPDGRNPQTHWCLQNPMVDEDVPAIELVLPREALGDRSGAPPATYRHFPGAGGRWFSGLSFNLVRFSSTNTDGAGPPSGFHMPFPRPPSGAQ